MAKRDNNINFKGILDVDLSVPFVKITEFEKQGGETIEKTYDILKELEQFNGREVAFRTAESKPIEPISDGE